MKIPRLLITIFIFVIIANIASALVFSKTIPYRPGYEFTNITDSVLTQNNFYLSLANFDGVRYLSIACRGYISEAAFFPLYPILIKIISLFSTNFDVLFIAGVTCSIAFYLSLIYISFRLIKDDFGKNVAFWSVGFLILFPTSFFLFSVYSESLFLFLLVLTFTFARKQKWFAALVSAFFLCATRLVGVFVIPAIIYEYVKQNNSVKKSFIFIFSGLSLVLYSIYNFWKFSDFLYFLRVHGELGNGRETTKIILIPQTLYRYFKILTTIDVSSHDWKIALLEISMFFLISLLLFIAIRKQIRTSYLIFSLLAFLFPAFSGTFTGVPRYAIVAFPVFIVLGMIKNKWYKICLMIIFFILQLILFGLFSRGYFVA